MMSFAGLCSMLHTLSAPAEPLFAYMTYIRVHCTVVGLSGVNVANAM